MGEVNQNQSDATDGSGFRDLTGREIGRYHIQKRLGRGGLTTVYQAYDIVDGIPVALKVLLHNTDEKVYNRFRYEAQTAAKLWAWPAATIPPILLWSWWKGKISLLSSPAAAA